MAILRVMPISLEPRGLWSIGRKLQKDVEEILSEENGTWDLDHLKSRILDVEELLHLQLIWRRVNLSWLLLGNGILIVVSVLASAEQTDTIARFKWPLIVVAAVSVLLSPVVAYNQYKRTRATRLIIKKLNIVYRRNKALQAADQPGADSGSVLPQQKRYRDDVQDVVARYREEANKYRRIHNRFQSVIIVGSVGTSAVTTASVSYGEVRWAAVGISAVVGLAAGFTGYFKYRERSFNLQQTADAIEREYESVELRVGRYKGMDEAEAYATFADAVERLRDEQNKRQQQLDQPVDVKREES